MAILTVTDMLIALLGICSKEELEEEEAELEVEEEQPSRASKSLRQFTVSDFLFISRGDRRASAAHQEQDSGCRQNL